ncbi:MAG: response regulator [Nevskiales bacterium]|nr:response regulator [Nevskiales bacterium]
MNKPLNEVLLVDDNEADNFLHRAVLEDMGVADRIVERLNGQEALDYLLTPDDQGRFPSPDLICLDINMPIMSGWEFLDSYEQLPPARRRGVVVMMLTTSLNPEDAEQARERSAIGAFSNKPLTSTKVLQLIEEHFPGRS